MPTFKSCVTLMSTTASLSSASSAPSRRPTTKPVRPWPKPRNWVTRLSPPANATCASLAQNERDAKLEELARGEEKLVAEAKYAQQVALTQQAREVSLMKAKQEVVLAEQQFQRAIEERRYEQMQMAQRALILAPAEAQAEATQIMAKAALYAKETEATGLQKVMEAQADGLRKLLESCSGNPEALQFWLGVDSGLWKHVATESANAIRNLKPTINQWQTGPGPAGQMPLSDWLSQLMPLYHQFTSQLKRQ